MSDNEELITKEEETPETKEKNKRDTILWVVGIVIIVIIAVIAFLTFNKGSDEVDTVQSDQDAIVVEDETQSNQDLVNDTADTEAMSSGLMVPPEEFVGEFELIGLTDAEGAEVPVNEPYPLEINDNGEVSGSVCNNFNTFFADPSEGKGVFNPPVTTMMFCEGGNTMEVEGVLTGVLDQADEIGFSGKELTIASPVGEAIFKKV